MTKQLLFVCPLLMISLIGYAQISVPSSITVNTPLTFTSGEKAATYSWNFRNMDFNPSSYTPPTPVSATLNGITAIDYSSAMVYDDGNYYVFFTGSTGVQRVNFGNDPNNTPGTAENVRAANTRGGVDVVYDEDAAKWYVVTVRAGDNVDVIEFANGLGQASTGVQTVTIPDLSGVPATIAMVKDKGEWFGFTAGWKVARIDFGADLSNVSGAQGVTLAEGATVPTNEAIGAVYYSGLYKQDNEWFLLAAQQASSSKVARLEFGADLQNKSPNVYFSSLPGAVGNVRGMTLAHTCGKLYGFIQREGSSGSAAIQKIDFGSSFTNPPTLVATYNLSTASFQYATAYVYNDTFCMISHTWGNAMYRTKLIPLVAEQHKYYDNEATHTFTSAASYDITLILNQGGRNGGMLTSYCRTVNVSAVPSGPAQPGLYTAAPASVCREQNNVTYTVPAVNDAVSYRWNYTGTGASYTNLTTNPTNTISFDASATSGILQVWAVNSNNVQSQDPRDTSVTVHTLPVISISPGAPSICIGNNITLTASGAVTYSWDHSGGANAAATFTPGATTTYTVTGTDGNGCVSLASRQVTVNQLPVISISPGTAAVCAGGSIQLTASGATTYSWSPAGGSAATATVSPSSTTTYTVEGTNSTTGCKNTATREVTVNVLPGVNIAPATVAICNGQSATLTASGANTYSWSPTGGSAATATVSPSSTTTYTVEGTNTSTGCKNTATHQVTVNTLPVTQVTVTGGITEVCAGDSVVLTASGSGYNYQWKQDGGPVGTGNRHAARTTGNYKVVATDQLSGCVDSTQEIDLRVYDRPVVSLDHNDTAFCRGGVVRLEVSTQDTGLTYLWKEDGVANPLATASFLEVGESGVYQVVVGRSAVAMCEDSTNEVTVTVHELPVIDIEWDGEVLHATPGYVSYQWYSGDQGLIGEEDSTYRPASNGGYRVMVVDSNGCTASSPVQNLTDVSVGAVVSATDIKVYPNPSEGVVYIQAPVRVDALLLGVDGRILQRMADVRELDLRGYAAGVYLLRLMNADGMVIGIERVMKQ